MSSKSKKKGPGKVLRSQHEQLQNQFQASQRTVKALLDALTDLSVALLNGQEILDAMQLPVEEALKSDDNVEITEALISVRELLNSNERRVLDYIVKVGVPKNAVTPESVRRCIARLANRVFTDTEEKRKEDANYLPELDDTEMCMLMGEHEDGESKASRYEELKRRVYGSLAENLI